MWHYKNDVPGGTRFYIGMGGGLAPLYRSQGGIRIPVLSVPVVPGFSW